MKQILIFISLFLAIVCNINAQSITANQFNGRLQMTTVSNVSDSTWSITGYFTNSVNKYTTTQVAVNDKFFCQIGANTYVGRISVINSASDVTKLITFRVICNYPNPPNNIGAIVRTTSNGYPVFVDGLPNALQAGIQNYFATLVNTNAAGSPCEQTITQSTHGFRDFTPVRWNSNTSRYERSTHDTIVPDYIVVDSLTANTFKVANCGTYTTSLANGLYWFTSASPGYSLTADTTKVPLFQALNGKLILNPIVGFNLMSTGTDELADTAAAIRADFPNGIISALPNGDVNITGQSSSDLRIQNTRIQFDNRFKVGQDSSFIHDPAVDTTLAKGSLRIFGTTTQSRFSKSEYTDVFGSNLETGLDISSRYNASWASRFVANSYGYLDLINIENNGDNPRFNFYNSRGTSESSKTRSQVNDYVGFMMFAPYNGTAYHRGAVIGTTIAANSAAGSTRFSQTMFFGIDKSGNSPQISSNWLMAMDTQRVWIPKNLQVGGLVNGTTASLFVNSITSGNVGINTVSPTSKLQVVGSIAFTTTIISSATTLGEHTVVFATGASTYLVTLPSASSCAGRKYIIKVNGGGKTISSFLDLTGSASTTLTNNTVLTIVSDGTNWQQL